MRFQPCRPQAASSPTIQKSHKPCLHPPRFALTQNQLRMYKLEKEENFRWIARLLASPSSRVLTSSDLIAPDVQHEIADIGQFAEVAHGSIDPEFVWRNLDHLVQPTFPLEGYDALVDSTLVCVFHSDVAKLQGYISYRPKLRQLVIAFSGTSSGSQALHDLDVRMVPYPILGSIDTGKATYQVHNGFCQMYRGLRKAALENCDKALNSLDATELVLTGHSLGAVQASFFLMELLQNTTEKPDGERTRLPPGIIIKMVGFGSPRIGNEALVSCYHNLVASYRQQHGEDILQEYFVRGYNDGVPCLPPKAFGYRHLTTSPLYLLHGRLYRIPPSEGEHSVFPVQLDDDASPAEFPLGGHNYYNNRDMEKIQRRIRCLKLLTLGETGWQERYKRYWSKESAGKI